MDNVGLFLVIGIVGMVACVGLVVVGLLWKPAAKTDKARPAPAESAAAAPAAAGGPREVLRVLRDAATEELFVEVAGQRYSRMADIHQGSVREGFRSTLRDLEAFAGGAPTVPPVVVKPVPQPEPVPVTPSLTNIGTAKQAATATTPGTGPLLAPSMNPFKQMLVLRDLAKVQLPPVKTIAEQIDEIVQEKLADSPLAQRGVKVHIGPKGNALFRADGQDYEAVDELPDDEIRGLIRAAVAEWEKKQ
jgi:hypothetical protein